MPCSACEQAGRHAAAQSHEDSNCHREDWFRQRDDSLQREREAKRAKRQGANSKPAQLKPAEPKPELSQQVGPQPAPTTSAETEAVPRTPWLGYGIQPVSGPLTPSTEGKTGLRSTNPMYGRRPLTPGASPAGECSVP